MPEGSNTVPGPVPAMEEDLETRIDALERAITDGEGEFDEIRTAAETAAHLDRLDTDLGELQDRVCELEAATQALRGYVGNVRAVNDDVESKADAALAKTEEIEAALAESPSDGTAEQRHMHAPETHDDGGMPRPSRTDDTPRKEGDGSGTGGGGTWSSLTEEGSTRQTPADEDAGGTAPHPEHGGGREHTDSTTSRCDRCGRPRTGGDERGGEDERSHDIDPPDTGSHARGTNERGTLRGTDGDEPDLAGLSEERHVAPHSEPTTGADEPGTLERIRQLL